MRGLAPIDVALLPVGGWGPRLPGDHLNPLSAAEALGLLRAAACVPVHWGTIYPPWLPPELNARWAEWPHAFARHAAHLAPGVDVRILHPGETTVFTAEGGERREEHTCSFDLPEQALVPGAEFPVARLETSAGPVAVGR